MFIIVQNMEAVSFLRGEVAVAVFTAVGKFNILVASLAQGAE